jgi:ligand-binding sensor domain-containing protein
MPFINVIKALLVLALSAPGSAFLFAQTTTVYNTANSLLPNNAVRCITVDTNNVVWVGTDYGLASFDGINWNHYYPGNSPLNDYYIRALEVDSLNRIWIGTLDQGIFIFDGSAWLTINTSNSGIPDNSIREIQFGMIPGTYWVATGDGLGYFDGSVWTTWDALNSAFYTNNISSVAINSSNEKRIGTLNGGLHILDSSNTFLTLYTHSNSGLPDNTAYKVEFDASGNLWMATPSAGLLVHLGGDSWLWYAADNLLFPTNSTNYLLIDDGLVYVSTYDKGLVVFDGNTYSEYNSSNSGFPENYLRCIAKDKDGILWLGTDTEGLIRFDRALGINDPIENENIHVWPRVITAENNLITISSKNDLLNYSIIDLNGKTISSGNVNEKTILFPACSPGIYILELYFKNVKYSIKIAVAE